MKQIFKKCLPHIWKIIYKNCLPSVILACKKSNQICLPLFLACEKNTLWKKKFPTRIIKNNTKLSYLKNSYCFKKIFFKFPRQKIIFIPKIQNICPDQFFITNQSKDQRINLVSPNRFYSHLPGNVHTYLPFSIRIGVVCWDCGFCGDVRVEEDASGVRAAPGVATTAGTNEPTGVV